jgi:DNA-binding beta-propeller fold protein YncE
MWDPGALAVDGSGDVLVADRGNRTIRELAAHTGMFFGVAIAADHLGTVAGEGSYGPYLQDGLSALGETAELNFPTGLAVDPAGDLYIADGSMHAIRFVPAATTMLRGEVASADALYLAAGALSSGGILDAKTSWVQTRMVDPTGLTLSPRGQLIYADSQADVVRQLPLGT